MSGNTMLAVPRAHQTVAATGVMPNRAMSHPFVVTSDHVVSKVVCRHARASSVEITLQSSNCEISVRIRDDGRGFRMPHRTGLGLIGMQERAASLGGTLTVGSEPGKGTTIEIALPLPKPVPVNTQEAVSWQQIRPRSA